MGVWLGALGRLWLYPQPKAEQLNELIKEYVNFSKTTCPRGYREDEVFPNPWFFDENNMLASGVGKFAEPDIWYLHLKYDFFQRTEYRLCGDPVIIGEDYYDFWNYAKERAEEWKSWKQRVDAILSKSEGIKTSSEE